MKTIAAFLSGVAMSLLAFVLVPFLVIISMIDDLADLIRF